MELPDSVIFMFDYDGEEREREYLKKHAQEVGFQFVSIFENGPMSAIK